MGEIPHAIEVLVMKASVDPQFRQLLLEFRCKQALGGEFLLQLLKGQLQRAYPLGLLLRVVEGMPYAEISTLLGIPEGTVMSHVHRSKKFARERLTERAPVDGGNR